MIAFSLGIGDDIKYNVDKIQDSLKVSADAVVRNKVIIFELEGIDKAVLHVSYAITILKKSALKHTYFVKPYDQFSKVKDIKGKVYDGSGKVVKKIRVEDIKDYSANLEGSLFLDSRIKFIDPEYSDYPFTIEYSFELHYNGLLNYPDWQLYRDYNVAVEYSSYTIVKPQGYEVRTLERNIDIEENVFYSEGFWYSTWEMSNRKALKYEPLSPPLEERSPGIMCAPSDFLIDDYQGNCNTWNNFGLWIKTLNEGKRELSEETKANIQALIQGAESDYKKSEILYNYLQDNTRYVSVQMGIGGWQPIEASEVDELLYGDCKALTNYMQAMLDVAGIDSYYTLVKAGRNSAEIIADFPSSQFNHAILSIPIEKDTVWLECTSQRMPFGYIGSFTDDRNVLLINDEGGVIVRTKVYSIDDNKKICKATIQLDEYGDGHVTIASTHSGYYYDKRIPVLLSDDYDQKKMIRDELHIPNFVLDSYTLQESRSKIPKIEDTIKVTIDGYGTSFGNRMAVNLNMLNRLEKIPSKKEDRQSEIVIRRSIVEFDTLVYTIPKGFRIEKISKARNVESEFGEFETAVKAEGNEIHFARYLKLNKGTFPSESYDKFYEFYKSVKKGDDDRVILVKNDYSLNE